MSYRHAYDSFSFRPPAPVVEVRISAPIEGLTTTMMVLGLVDSGADITLIPQNLIEELGLASVGETDVTGFNEESQTLSLYSASISIPSLEDKVVRVVALEKDYAIIGRDIINHWKVVLDGKGSILEIG